MHGSDQILHTKRKKRAQAEYLKEKSYKGRTIETNFIRMNRMKRSFILN